MKELDVLRKSWKEQMSSTPIVLDKEKIAAVSYSKLMKFEKKILRINIVKTVGIIIATVLLMYTMLFATPFTAVKTAAVGLLVISIVNFWTKYLKLQLKTSKLNVKENSLDFIDDVLKNFSAQREFFKKDFMVFGALLVAGLNIIYLDLLDGMPVLERIGFHVIMTAVMLAVLFSGLKFRMRRFKNENGPIEKELINIKEDLSENGVS